MKIFLSGLFTLTALLLLFSVKTVSAEVSVNTKTEGNGNCSNHVRIESNGVVKEINSTDCSDISLSIDNNGNSTSSTSPNPTSSPAPTSHPTATPHSTMTPTSQPTDSASPSAEPTATPSAQPNPTPDQNSWIDNILDSISGLLGSIFGNSQ